jgi:predicted extracellular nuclease
MQAAKTLRKAIDSVLDVNPNAKILCMGDFNDHPTDNSLIKGLKAGRKAVKPMDMVNLMTPLAKAGLGSHNYKGEWGMLDQIIASYSFLKLKKGVRIKKEEAKIFKKDWMLYKGESPSKTYGGPNYYGGYSDHLPVYVILK